MPEPFTLAFPRPLPAERDGEHWWVESGGVRLRLSNLDKVFWPEDGYTKGDLLSYYWNVAPSLLPQVENRPLTMKRMPDGIRGAHFYQKDAPDHTPDWMPRCAIEPEDGEIDEMLMANSQEHILFVANLGAIEFHPLHSRCESYDRPDYLVFDLDPFSPAGFEEALMAARHVRVALEALGLQSFPKTSGATGVQIYVPVASHHSYEDSRALSERIGRMILQADPGLVTMEWSVSERAGRVFIDHNMNRRGASLAAAYSVRPRDGAPVSAPLRWWEVEEGSVRPEHFRIDNILERLEEVGDLFAPLSGGEQDLTEAMLELGLEPSARPETSKRVRRRITGGSSGSQYERKRSFESTPEPPAEHVATDVDPLTAAPGSTFVIQQHHATRLHHDLRLEMMSDDTSVLVSWAIPKGLPRRRGERTLAIHTEDHPMGYASFSGTIPEGNYGAGVVRIFDKGTYDVVERSDERLTVRLQGQRLAGIYHLVRTDRQNGKDQWLAIMSEDERPVGDERPCPEPMLATLTSEAFDDPDWGFEPKWDGIRAIAVCAEETRLISRNERDITAAYPELSSLHDQVVALEAMLDGEIVAFYEGIPSFQRLQQRMHVRDERRLEQVIKTIPVTFLAFDVLYVDGQDLTGESLRERRRILEEMVVPSQRLQPSPVIERDGKALFRAVSEQGMEGIVAKRLTSRYQPGARSRDWLKVKVTFDADVVVAGWTEGEGRRAGTLGSLVMAVYDEGELRYVGNVGTGFERHSLADAMHRLEQLEEMESPFPSEAGRSRAELRGVRWVEPVLVARVKYRELTSAGRLRASSFQEFREDKPPEECTFSQLVKESSARRG